jgi:predicted S18 family serine protease
MLTSRSQGVKVLTVKTIAHAEEFLRLSQRELHSSLNTLKLEYVTTIRKLAETAKEKRFKALRDAIRHLDPRLQPKLREEIVGTCSSEPCEAKGVY